MKVVIVKDSREYTKLPTLFQNDFGFALTFNIRDDANNAYDLGTSLVNLRINNFLTETELFKEACTISSTTSGICSYTFEQGQLNTSGVFIADLEISSDILLYSVSLGKLQIDEN